MPTTVRLVSIGYGSLCPASLQMFYLWHTGLFSQNRAFLVYKNEVSTDQQIFMIDFRKKWVAVLCKVLSIKFRSLDERNMNTLLTIPLSIGRRVTEILPILI
jgi:hypothetical protein